MNRRADQRQSSQGQSTATNTPIVLEALPERVGIAWPAFWVLTGCALVAGHFVVVWVRGLGDAYWQMPLILGLMFAWIPLEIIWSHERLRDFHAMKKPLDLCL